MRVPKLSSTLVYSALAALVAAGCASDSDGGAGSSSAAVESSGAMAESGAETSSGVGTGGSSGSATTTDASGSAGSDTTTATGGEGSSGDVPAPIDCPSTCEDVLPGFCAGETVTEACATNCAAENEAAIEIGAPCSDAYTAWFACVFSSFEIDAAATCAMAVDWYETHVVPPPDTICYTELAAFAAACMFD